MCVAARYKREKSVYKRERRKVCVIRQKIGKKERHSRTSMQKGGAKERERGGGVT